MKGKAVACGAITIVNAIAGWRGSALAVDLKTTAEVTLDPDTNEIIGDAGGLDPTLIEKTVEKTLDWFGMDLGGAVKTESMIPPSRGLKSSSAAANATVLATASALDCQDEITSKEVLQIGIEAAIEAEVTITGAFDDASASLLGGLTITDNWERELLEHREFERKVVILVPSDTAHSSKTNVERAELLEPLVLKAHEMALEGQIADAMTLNGLLYCATLDFNKDIPLEALEAGAEAAGLSGTGTAYAALVDSGSTENVKEAWEQYGDVIETETNNKGGEII
ncbi:shikimate kinase [Methanonatronarchaeum sp. AMET6-2]|uniref:shikimate kinase n=1 Tax=Methanonatronarchaeum sp. AMET6-2 TaxID=2933293 RepID=UPI0012216520|nr:shikimate kinase [Methanonatronarchaeum sp. AMET6-2]RZN62640.1 MAG: shikimate kinase [Methanonatronarchaeia archaeon]UOY10041.1 shikimate kinase [Methanonatronarchaeum sp. AMET6-2]